jgi:hypothetical protein
LLRALLHHWQRRQQDRLGEACDAVLPAALEAGSWAQDGDARKEELGLESRRVADGSALAADGACCA